MPDIFITQHLDEPHYIYSAWRTYTNKYLFYPVQGLIFSVTHYFSEQKQLEAIDRLLDAYPHILKENGIDYTNTLIGIGKGKRNNVYTLATLVSGPTCYTSGPMAEQELINEYAKLAAEHHAKAVFMEKI